MRSLQSTYLFFFLCRDMMFSCQQHVANGDHVSLSLGLLHLLRMDTSTMHSELLTVPMRVLLVSLPFSTTRFVALVSWWTVRLRTLTFRTRNPTRRLVPVSEYLSCSVLLCHAVLMYWILHQHLTDPHF